MKLMQKGLLFEQKQWFTSKLIRDYIKCGDLRTAHLLWRSAGTKFKKNVDIKLYGMLISARMKNGEFDECRNLFLELKQRQIPMNDAICLLMLKACAQSNNFELAKIIHSDIENKEKIFRQIKIQNALIGFYTKFAPNTAHQIFANLKNIDLEPNEVTYLQMIKLVGSTKDITFGIKLHQMIKLNKTFEQNIRIQNALISMYALCDDFDSALCLFHQIKNGKIPNCQMDEITYLNIIHGCALHRRLKEGIMIHGDIEHLHTSIKLNNALIDLYGHCKEYELAKNVFYKMKRRNKLTYSIILNVCIKCQRQNEIEIFWNFLKSECDVDEKTLRLYQNNRPSLE